MFYSKTTGGFYSREIHGEAIPVDAVEITDQSHAALIDGQASGQRIIADGDGFPILADQPPATAEKISARIKKMRDDRRFNGGVKVGAHWFRSDVVAVGEYTALALIGASLPLNTVLRAAWRTMEEGVTVDMTVGLVRQILAAGFAAVAANDDVAEAHLAAVAASQNPAAYDYATGWPEIFGEE